MHVVLVIFIFFHSLDNLWGAANIDSKLGNVKRPVLSRHLGIGFDTIAIRFVDRVRVVFAGLYGVGFELLCDLGHNLVVVGGRRLVVVDVG